MTRPNLRTIFDLINWEHKKLERPHEREGFKCRFDGEAGFLPAARILGNLKGETGSVLRTLYYWQDWNGEEHLLVTEAWKAKKPKDEDTDGRR